MLGRLRASIAALRARLRARPDSEHEQALVRLVIGIVLFFYLLPKAVANPDGVTGFDHGMFGVMLGFLLAAVVLFVLAARSTRISPVRRVVSVLIDIGTASYFVLLLNFQGLPLLMIFVWVAVANGFRFGPKYLLFALGVSLAGFGAVAAVSPFWRANLWVTFALATIDTAFCLYVLSLVNRMFGMVAKAEAANHAKRRFISVVSHEMRTPLNAIIGMGDLLGESDLKPEQAEMMRTVTASSRNLLRLVEDVLDFSKIESGRLAIEQTDFDLHALVNGTVRIIRPQAEAKGLVLSVVIMPEVPHALCGDPHRLRQVLINLVSNAVKFTAEGSVVVHLSQLAEDAESTRIKFSVRDTGIGIPPEVQGRIFESFVQADQSTTRQYGGTGLGTAIAKQLVELMGGRMGLESAVGLGSTFWFEVGFAKQKSSVAAAAAESFLSGARVLTIGFGHDDQEALTQSLRAWGATVLAAGSTEAAVQRLAVGDGSAAIHSAIVYADRVDTARQTLAALHRANAAVPPLLLCIEAASGRSEPLAVPADLAAAFGAVLHLPLERRLLFNALHAVSASEEREASPGVVRLRDYLDRRAHEASFRIIIADDSATNRQVVSKILERGGHTVAAVPDGEDVLDAIEEQDFDLVILDRNMPGLDGVATTRALRAIEAASGRRIPIVILSADATQEARDESLAAGVDRFLSKPLEATRLLEEVAQLCGPSASRRAPTAPAAAAPVVAVPTQRAAVINAETLRLLEELSSQPGFIERLAATFVKDQVELMAQMERAVDAADYAEYRRLLHAMKGSASSLGAERLAETCGRTQRLGDDDMRRKPDLVAAVREELDRARTALDRHIEERRRTAG